MSSLNRLLSIRIVRMPELTKLLGLSRSTVYNFLNIDSPQYAKDFPRPIRLGDSPRSAVGWIESEVTVWLEGRQRTTHQRPNE